MLPAWFLRTLRLGRFDAIVIGSDPAFSPLVAIALRLAYPRAAHRALVLRPLPGGDHRRGRGHGRRGARARRAPPHGASPTAATTRSSTSGPRMRERLADYGSGARQETLVPWALTEAEQPVAIDDGARAPRCSRGAKLALLYSGTMGRAHDFAAFLRLGARLPRPLGRRGHDMLRGPRQPRRRAARRDRVPTTPTSRLVDFADERDAAARGSPPRTFT